jgi:guanine deaminase
MIIAGQLLLDDGVGSCRIEPGFIRVDESQIVEVVTGEIPASADLGDRETLISPGLIDAHVHLPQFDITGAHGLTLLNWLNEVTFPEEMRWADSDYGRAKATAAMKQLFSFGTTGICAYATVHHDAARAAIQIATNLGMRGVIGQVLMDRQAPTELCRSVEQLLDEAAALSDEFPSGLPMAAAVTPRFAVSCSERLLEGAGRIAQQTQAIVQTHLAETQNECQLVRELFSGADYVDVYQDAGLLGSKSLLGHGIYLNQLDRSKLQDTGSMIAHCPTANSFLRSGTMNRAELLGDSVKVAIGSDIGAGYERNMVRVARSMIEAASLIGDGYPNAATAWHSITAGNADLLGWADTGRLEVGKSAEVLVIRPDIQWLTRPFDPLSMLMFAWDDRWIKHVFAGGRQVFQG